LLHRDEVDRRARIEHLRQGSVNRLMPEIVKSFLAVVLQFLHAFAQAIIRRKQNTTQYALLRLRTVRRQTVQFARVSPVNRFLPPGFFEISACTGGFGNRINHGRQVWQPMGTKTEITLRNFPQSIPKVIRR